MDDLDCPWLFRLSGSSVPMHFAVLIRRYRIIAFKHPFKVAPFTVSDGRRDIVEGKGGVEKQLARFLHFKRGNKVGKTFPGMFLNLF